MKALEILNNDNIFDERYLSESRYLKDDIIEAIKELEELQNRTCENCINDYQCDIQDKLELQDYSLKFGCTFFKKRELINGK